MPQGQRPPQQATAAQPAARPAPAPMTAEQADRVASSPFSALGLLPTMVRALLDEGYEVPTPIQSQVIGSALSGRDVLGCAQTGTGKTAAFVLPILQRLSASAPNGRIRALVLTPTRELAAQIGERVSAYGRHLNLRHEVVYGGVSQVRQEQALRRLPDVLVATPGRLLDLMGQGVIHLDGVEYFVLDEADRMLDMGFVHDVKRVIAKLPQKRQTLFFSATMPPAIDQLARSILVDPARVAVAPVASTADTVDQKVVFVAKADKRAMLERVLSEPKVERAIVFTRTKHGANRLSEQLGKAGIGSAAIHGNKSQNARERALEAFRAGTTRVLVATDLAARGIDVEGISHVINFDLPDVAEQYVHRIGRTGRAGATGSAISFCDHEERPLLADIERLIRRKLPHEGELGPMPAHAQLPPPAPRGGSFPRGNARHGARHR